MNHRIKKKKRKLAKMRASKWKDVKLNKKRTHAVGIAVRHCLWRSSPHRDNYAIYLRHCRCRCWKLGPQIVQHDPSPLPSVPAEMLNKAAENHKFMNDRLF
jgi:hypothetical protein